ncbi:MAG TPA: nucleotidyltransferase family protein [Candidatus Sulfotelmatobacter sp.]|nr:nucleotidyltransferase family protein [Candidatus Sulfotelmatobacter sp.]
MGTSSYLAEVASRLSPERLDALKTLAISNHVIVRAFRLLKPLLAARGNHDAAESAAAALQEERLRIERALRYLHTICSALEQNGCAVTVIKSLDHWPDLGSDLDLYTDTDASKVVQVMSSQFGGKLAERSWGDRLANKWNFIIPGLTEMIEIHVQRLGQTGEQTAFTQFLLPRTRIVTIGGKNFRVLAPEDRIIISTLQRMYRHFYIRLCDIIDNARLLDSREVDFDCLHTIGYASGLWEGIATYLVVISQYVERYRGYGVPLPSLVTNSAKFGVTPVRFRKDFLRVPILPHSLNLYAGELKTLLFRGQLRNSLRLSLLPGLATAAALEMRISGSDKGIW